MPPRHRRQRPASRDERTPPIASKHAIRLAYVGILGLYAQILVFIIHFFKINAAYFQTPAACLVSGTALLYLYKALDERPAAARRRIRARVWADVHALVRDGIRIISVASARTASTDSRATSPSGVSPQTSPQTSPSSSPKNKSDVLSPNGTPRPATTPLPAGDRTDELLGILAGFPIGLQHHLQGTRALPHPPLCDLLPPEYLTSLKRTETRVRFAANHAGPSGSGSPASSPAKIDAARLHANGKASDDEGDDDKLATPKKSNLHSPYPSNLPVSLLRLLEAYIMGFADLPVDRGGWSALQSERTLTVVKGLNAAVSHADAVYSDPNPLIDARFCQSVFLFTLPLWLVCMVRGWPAVVLTMLVASGMRFSMEAVFSDQDDSPAALIHNVTTPMLHEALDTCPSLSRYYRARLVARLGSNSPEVSELDRRNRRRDEWLPTF